MKPLLNDNDFCRAAKKLKCEVAAIKAVAEVESRGQGFYASGFPVILFERHKFRSFTRGKYNQSHPHLSGAAGGYGKAGQNQVNKFNEAFALNPIAAMKSCSWGKFQIMGFNHEVCGYATVGEFVDAMKESEGKQLDAFVDFVIGNGLGIHLRTKNWAKFASGYNGASYRINKYDTKMATAYAKYAKQNIDCSKVSGASSTPVTQSAGQITPLENTPQNAESLPITQNAETIVNAGDGVPVEPLAEGDRATDPPVQVSQGGFKSLVATIVGGIGGGATAIWGALTSDTGVMIVGILCVTVLLLSLIFRQVLMDWLRMKLHADPKQGNVK